MNPSVFAFVKMSPTSKDLPRVQWAVSPPVNGTVQFGMSPHRFALSRCARLALAQTAQNMNRTIRVVTECDADCPPIKVYEPGWKNVLAIFILELLCRRG